MSNYLSDEKKEELAKLAEKVVRELEGAFCSKDKTYLDEYDFPRAVGIVEKAIEVSSLIEENAELKAQLNRTEKLFDEAGSTIIQLGKGRSAAEAERDKLRIERDKFERKYRERIWLSHGCFGMYGDDGEMQCNNGARHGLLDFKRDSVEKLDAALFAMNLKEIAEKQAAEAALKNGAGKI